MMAAAVLAPVHRTFQQEMLSQIFAQVIFLSTGYFSPQSLRVLRVSLPSASDTILAKK